MLRSNDNMIWFRFDKNSYLKVKNQIYRALDIAYLLKNNYLRATSFPFTNKWIHHKDKFAFTGQYDPRTYEPHGIVRLVDSHGQLFEGNWIGDRKHGWNISYHCTKDKWD